MRTAIVAALPREIAGIVRSLPQPARSEQSGVLLYETDKFVIACAGMGRDRVTRAVAAVLARGNVGRLLSIGLAGACDAAKQAGDVLRVSVVIDTTTGERFDTGAAGAVLATSPTLADVAEKRRLFLTYGAAAVDMEAAFVARLALAKGLRFDALKAISDDASFSLEGMHRFITADGQFRERAFAAFVAARPHRWKQAVALGRQSARALKALTRAVQIDGDAACSFPKEKDKD